MLKAVDQVLLITLSRGSHIAGNPGDAIKLTRAEGVHLPPSRAMACIRRLAERGFATYADEASPKKPLVEITPKGIAHVDAIIAENACALRTLVRDARLPEPQEVAPVLTRTSSDSPNELFQLLKWAFVIMIAIYVAYLIISSLPVSVAIVLGAIIIGGCILLATIVRRG